MAEQEQAATANSLSTNAAGSTTASSILETADSVLNTIGDMTGQNETIQKTTAFVGENVLKSKKLQNIPGREGYDDGAAKEQVDNVPDEKIEEFMRHQNRSYQG